MMLSQLRIRDLELILALHEEANVTRAAERVRISEPAFSKQLRKLERRLQMKLFERFSTGMKTTPCGCAFMTHAYDSVHAFYRAINDAHESKFSEQQKLRIGASSFLSNQWVELLRSVELRSYRQVTIALNSAYTFDLLSRIQRKEIDIALVTSPPLNPSISTLRVAVNPFVIVMRQEHPLAGKKSLDFRDVAKFPWVFFERNVHRSLHDMILRKAEIQNVYPRISHWISQADQVPALLGDNSTVAWLTPNGASRVIGNGLIGIPLDDLEIRLEIHCATLASNNSPLVSEFVRSFVKRVEENRGPIQLTLPIGGERAA